MELTHQHDDDGPRKPLHGTEPSTRNDDEDDYVDGDDDDCGDEDHSRTTIAGNDEQTYSTSTGGGRSEAYHAVKRSKLLVYLVLLLTAAGAGTATYFFTANQQTKRFEYQYTYAAKDLQGIVEFKVLALLDKLKSLSDDSTSWALASNETWPNVTIPHFPKHTGSLTNVEVALFTPLVPSQDVMAWEEYAVQNQAWIDESLTLTGLPDLTHAPIQDQIYSPPESTTNGSMANLHLPIWQIKPVLHNDDLVMMDMYAVEAIRDTAGDAVIAREARISEILDLHYLTEHGTSQTADVGFTPTCVIIQPVFESFDANANVVAFYMAVIRWKTLFEAALRDDIPTIIAEITSTAGTNFTILVTGQNAESLPGTNLSNPTYEHLVLRTSFDTLAQFKQSGSDGYTISLYPSDSFNNHYQTGTTAILYTAAVIGMFVFTLLVFFAYDILVERRQRKVSTKAKKTEAIISAMFPEDVRKRLMDDVEQRDERGPTRKAAHLSAKTRMHDYMKGSSTDDEDATDVTMSSSIADYFPHTSIMFADIVGFTAWSSTREPSQVFTLLETLFQNFDQIARRRQVFKVETVGDCYVAAAGLPEARKDHAIILARFARDCLRRFQDLTKKLEVLLGPDTTELGLRVGLHSGSVTAGVLRGDRFRFQLFGDTMNTASRVESTGMKNKIHVSQETALLIQEAGKGHWLKPREDKVVAKGKGELTTFWLDLRGRGSHSTASISSTSDHSEQGRLSLDMEKQVKEAVGPQSADVVKMALSDKKLRLVDWCTESILRTLREVDVRRKALNTTAADDAILSKLEQDTLLENHATTLDEVSDIITLPEFNADAATITQSDNIKATVGCDVPAQLRDFVYTVATMYRENPFHSFEHAAHMMMSVIKLLSRIVAPEIHHKPDGYEDKDLHDHTYGITSDPMTLFTSILAALIHDADHPGVPNAQLIAEGAAVAAAYQNKSIAEQNSIDLCWRLLMSESYKSLRRAIYVTEDEFKRFRQLLVNTVLATDIMDKDLGAARKARWSAAFDVNREESDKQVTDRRATIVIEHLIQASDVAHTMQHWHVYRKWNEKFFEENYLAFIEGRAMKDPAEFWYEGEKGFLDNYVIPLARKLKDCGVFGVSSDEYLEYAILNRREWEHKGQDIVAAMVEKVRNKYRTAIMNVDT